MSLEGSTVGGYSIVRRLGAGSFGEVYEGLSIASTGARELQKVAIKVENVEERGSAVGHELKVYNLIGDSAGIVKIFGSGFIYGRGYLVMELLGPSLEEAYTHSGKTWTVTRVVQLALQMASFVHRDIKPDNFCYSGLTNDTIFLIDFTLAKQYYDTRKQRHVRYKRSGRPCGTMRYASINSHRGFVLSRRDDLESLAYCCIYLAKGSLPWEGLKGNSKAQANIYVGEMKIRTPIAHLCTGLPRAFEDFLQYARDLEFAQDPDYCYVKKLFLDALSGNDAE